MPKYKFSSSAASIAKARAGVKAPFNPSPPKKKKYGAGGMQPDKPTTILAGTGSVPSLTGKLKSKAKEISSSGGSLGSIGGFQIKPTYGAQARKDIGAAQSSRGAPGRRGKFYWRRRRNMAQAECSLTSLYRGTSSRVHSGLLARSHRLRSREFFLG